MAGLTVWSGATWALLPPLSVAVLFALRGEVATRLVAVQLATALTVLLLALMSFAFDQDSYLDLAVTLALLALPGSLAMAVFIERWL